VQSYENLLDRRKYSNKGTGMPINDSKKRKKKKQTSGVP